MSARDEADLLVAWRGGDAAAGNELFDRYFDALSVLSEQGG